MIAESTYSSRSHRPGSDRPPQQSSGRLPRISCAEIGANFRISYPAEAAEILRIRESWLRAKAAARAIPCTFIGKHLRFSDDDIAQIMAEGARQPVTRGRGTRR